MKYPAEIQKLLDLFGKFPGVGPKTAERFVFWLLKQPNEYIAELRETLLDAQNANKFCVTCFSISPSSPCVICKDAKRDASTLCVVEDTADLYAIEAIGEYRGRYHVLGGLVNPLEGIMPEKLNVNALLERVKNPNIKEVILALNPTMEGETTLLYLAKVLKTMERNLKVTALGRGLPFGADLEYADALTISHALLGRRELKNTR